MPTYSYKGRSSQGQIEENSIVADTIDLARKRLVQQGLRVFYLEEEKSKGIQLGGEPKVGDMDLMMMTRQLSTLIRAGVPILTAIRSLSRQVENETLKSILKKVDLSIAGGKNFSKALSEHPKAFNDVYVNVVIAGEAGGILPEVLERLAVLIEKEHYIKSEVKSALRYPTYVTIALIGAFVFLVNFVVPKFIKMFASFKLELPLPTKILIFLSQSMGKYWYLYLIGVLLLIGFYKWFKKRENGRLLLDRMALRLPVIGNLILKFNMARAANLMGTLLKSGVPALNCLDIVRKTVDNKIIEREFLLVRRRVEAGGAIHEYMEESLIFPPMMANMVQIGEESGALDQTLETVAEHYEMETGYSVKSLTGMIEPLITVVTGAMVLFLALAIFLPMWDMTKVAKGG